MNMINAFPIMIPDAIIIAMLVLIMIKISKND